MEDFREISVKIVSRKIATDQAVTHRKKWYCSFKTCSSHYRYNLLLKASQCLTNHPSIHSLSKLLSLFRVMTHCPVWQKSRATELQPFISKASSVLKGVFSSVETGNCLWNVTSGESRCVKICSAVIADTRRERERWTEENFYRKSPTLIFHYSVTDLFVELTTAGHLTNMSSHSLSTCISKNALCAAGKNLSSASFYANQMNCNWVSLHM